MTPRMTALAMIATAAIAAPALAYTLVPAGQAIAVAKSGFTVVPTIAWNRMTKLAGRRCEIWTLDGIALNELSFYAGIADNEILFREPDRANAPLPRFAATMLAPDVAQLFESSYRLAGDSALFAIDTIEPARLAGHRGFRFGYSYVPGRDSVKRRGEATGAVIDGKLYLITFEAPAIHYFDRDLAAYRALVASATLQGGGGDATRPVGGTPAG